MIMMLTISSNQAIFASVEKNGYPTERSDRIRDLLTNQEMKCDLKMNIFSPDFQRICF